MTDPAQPTPPAPASQKGTGVSVSLIVGVILAVLVIILAAQNTDQVRFHFLWTHVTSPLVVIILGAGLAGVVLDEVAGVFWRRRRRRHMAERESMRRFRRHD